MTGIRHCNRLGSKHMRNPCTQYLPHLQPIPTHNHSLSSSPSMYTTNQLHHRRMQHTQTHTRTEGDMDGSDSHHGVSCSSDTISRTVRNVKKLSQLTTRHRSLKDDKRTLRDFISMSNSTAQHLNDTQNNSHQSLTTPLSESLLMHYDSVSSSVGGEEASDIIPQNNHKTYYIETYGCQMNTADSEIVSSILQSAGYRATTDMYHADILLVNTCSIRDNAEQKVRHRVNLFKQIKKPTTMKHRRYTHLHQHVQPHRGTPKIVVLGCMAERIKHTLLEEEKLVDIVCGPDAYRDLPRLLQLVDSTSEQQSNTQLSMDESYADVIPVRIADPNNLSAYVSITRGCDNLCSYCIVPYTRGRERSRSVESIVNEVIQLRDNGFKEITLLGQNVNSYNYYTERKLSSSRDAMSDGFVNISKRPMMGTSFTQLLDTLSALAPEVRFRFTSPHPKDVPDDLIELIATRPNICKQFHLPAQSGNTNTLKRMRRGYTRDAYLKLVEKMRMTLGHELSLSTDMIVGFCGESDDEFRDTLSLMRLVKYDTAFMFAYSERNKTHAYRTMKDDIPREVKLIRLKELVDTFHDVIVERNLMLVDSIQLVLIDTKHSSEKNPDTMSGKAGNGRRCFMPIMELPVIATSSSASTSLHSNTIRQPSFGDYVIVRVLNASVKSCVTQPIAITTLQQFQSLKPIVQQSANINLQDMMPNMHARPSETDMLASV